jgi:hypothetical protein
MKPEDNIEKIIIENLERFDEFEPNAGHFDRFEARLNKLHKKPVITFGIVWKAAAVLVFALMAVNQGSIYFSKDNSPIFGFRKSSEISLASVSPEHKETEFYYTTAINEGMTQWDRFAKEGLVTAEEQKALEHEMEEFEKIYKNLQNDLKANPGDDRIVNAMIEYYQAKLNVINMIINKLQEIKCKKSNNNENNNENTI